MKVLPIFLLSFGLFAGPPNISRSIQSVDTYAYTGSERRDSGSPRDNDYGTWLFEVDMTSGGFTPHTSGGSAGVSFANVQKTHTVGPPVRTYAFRAHYPDRIRRTSRP